MTSDLDMGGESPIELRRQRTFRARIWAGSILFILANLALGLWGHPGSPWRFVWVVLPLVPIVWMVIVIVLRVRQMDEYQVKLFFPGLAVGFTVSIVTAITVGTLSSAGFAVPNAGWIVTVAGVLSWAVTHLFVGAPNS